MKTLKHTLSFLVLPILFSCGGENTNTENESNEENSSNEIVVTTAQFNLGKMELGTFTLQSFQNAVKANGMLDVPPENKSTVSAYFGGYVKTISLLQGQKVTKGQTLFTLESPDYIKVQQEFLESKSQLSYLKSDYERQKELAATQVSSQKTYLKAESDYKTTLARFESLKKTLQLMNIQSNSVTEYNLTSTIDVKAPISGYVTSVLATKGMFLNPSDIALTIMNVDHMHVELTVFEQDLTKVKIGQEVSFTVQNNQTTYKANVFLINKAIDPEKRSVKVHCHFDKDADALTLIPGMYVEAQIFSTSDSAMALPVNSVISIENKSYILAKKTGTKEQINFEKIEVEVGKSNENFIEILNYKDFDNNKQILTNGAFNLIQE